MKDDKILTLHPEGGKGALLLLHDYELAKEAIVDFFLKNPTGTLQEIFSYTTRFLEGKITEDIRPLFDATVADMEARDYIERVPQSDPMAWRLKLIRC